MWSIGGGGGGGNKVESEVVVVMVGWIIRVEMVEELVVVEGGWRK